MASTRRLEETRGIREDLIQPYVVGPARSYTVRVRASHYFPNQKLINSLVVSIETEMARIHVHQLHLRGPIAK